MRVLKYILIFTLAGLVFYSCEDFEEYPVVPHIEYKEFGIVKDQAGKDSLGYLSITYTDGDGDIGLKETDTLTPYQYNFFLDIYELINDTLRKLILPDTNVNFNSRIPVLTPDGASKAIKGTIELELELYMMIPFLESDTIAFEMYIMDRALHKSNVVMTPQLVFN